MDTLHFLIETAFWLFSIFFTFDKIETPERPKDQEWLARQKALKRLFYMATIVKTGADLLVIVCAEKCQPKSFAANSKTSTIIEDYRILLLGLWLSSQVEWESPYLIIALLHLEIAFYLLVLSMYFSLETIGRGGSIERCEVFARGIIHSINTFLAFLFIILAYRDYCFGVQADYIKLTFFWIALLYTWLHLLLTWMFFGIIGGFNSILD